MEAKFTPGPWALDERIGCTVVAGDTVICSTRATHNGRRDPEEQEAEYQANANLIAASPLLYEALEAATEAYAYHYGEDCPLTIKCRNALRAARGEK